MDEKRMNEKKVKFAKLVESYGYAYDDIKPLVHWVDNEHINWEIKDLTDEWISKCNTSLN